MQRLLLTHFDQECFSVILEDADSWVVGSILDTRKRGLPRGHTRAEEHGTDGSSCRNTGFISDCLPTGCSLAAKNLPSES